MKPRWMRRYVACPDCGTILEDGSSQPRNAGENGLLSLPYKAFDCKKCGAHYTPNDFWREQEEKWDRTAVSNEEINLDPIEDASEAQEETV